MKVEMCSHEVVIRFYLHPVILYATLQINSKHSKVVQKAWKKLEQALQEAGKSKHLRTLQNHAWEDFHS
jgi:hypothetical protein